MNDEKLDLILNVVSDIKVKVDRLETRFDALETKIARIEVVSEKVDRLEENILLNRTDTVSNRRKIKDFEARLTRLENHVGIAV